jgi:glycosyltransferase involved in cell wall biosynthesis
MERQASWLADHLVEAGRRVVAITTMRAEGPGFSTRFALPWFERRRGVLIYRVPAPTWWSLDTRRELYETCAAWIIARHASWIDAIYAVQLQTAGVHAARLGPLLGLPTALQLPCSGAAGDIRTSERLSDSGAIFRALRRIDRVIHLNQESLEECLSVGLLPERLALIPNGVDLRKFPDDLPPASLPELGEASDRELVVFVGRLDPQKRVDVLLEAFAKIAARRPRARLALAGDGPLRHDLERLARDRGLLPERVAFLGVRSDVPNVLRAASVYVLPSAQEGVSIALLEALAARAPAVVTDIPGNHDTVRHEREGLLVPPGDAAALERAIERLLEDKSFARRLGEAGRARVEAEYAMTRIAKKSLAVFDALPARAPRSFARFLVRYARSDFHGPLYLAAREGGRLAKVGLTKIVIATKRRLGLRVDLPARKASKF